MEIVRRVRRLKCDLESEVNNMENGPMKDNQKYKRKQMYRFINKHIRSLAKYKSQLLNSNSDLNTCKQFNELLQYIKNVAITYHIKSKGLDFLLGNEGQEDTTSDQQIQSFFNKLIKVSFQSFQCIGCISCFSQSMNFKLQDYDDLITYSSESDYIILKHSQSSPQIIYKSFIALLNDGGGYVLFTQNSISQAMITQGFISWEEAHEIYQTIKRAIKNIKPCSYDFRCQIVPFEQDGFVIRTELLPNKKGDDLQEKTQEMHYHPFYNLNQKKPYFYYIHDGQIKEVKSDIYEFIQKKIKKKSSKHYGLNCESKCQSIEDYLQNNKPTESNQEIQKRHKSIPQDHCPSILKELESIHKKKYKTMFIFIPKQSTDPKLALNRLDQYINSRQQHQRKYEVIDLAQKFQTMSDYQDKNSYLILSNMDERYVKQLKWRDDFDDCIIYGVTSQIKLGKSLPDSYFKACQTNIQHIFKAKEKIIFISESKQFSDHLKEDINIRASLNLYTSQLIKMKSLFLFYFLYIHGYKPEFGREINE